MQTTPGTWTGPGSGSATAPNTFWVEDLVAGSNWQIQVTARNASGGLVTVASWSLSLWDVTTNAAALTVTGTNANTINLSGNMNTTGHKYTYHVAFSSGSCDHTLVTTTSIVATAGNWKNHPIAKRWSGSAWVEIGGPGILRWNGSAWTTLNGGVLRWTGSAWVYV